MYNFERAVRLRPGSAPHLCYALALARADRFDEAQHVLKPPYAPMVILRKPMNC
jgi:hypothetical protein